MDVVMTTCFSFRFVDYSISSDRLFLFSWLTTCGEDIAESFYPLTL